MEILLPFLILLGFVSLFTHTEAGFLFTCAGNSEYACQYICTFSSRVLKVKIRKIKEKQQPGS